VRNVLLSGLLLCAAAQAAAQVGLPAVRLPNLPSVGAPALPAVGLPPLTDEAAALGQLNPAGLRELRQQRIRELLRRHRDVLEADPHGAPIVRRELLAFSPQQSALALALAAGYTVVRERVLEELGARLVVLHAPDDTARSLTRLQGIDPGGSYDFNHVYLPSGAPPGSAQASSLAARVTTAASESAPATARVGLIDDGVDAHHAALDAVTIHPHGCAGASLPAAHGTAVASLLAGRAGHFRGAAPGAEVYAADVFCGRPTGGAVDEVSEAFSWLLHEQVPVINVSLVGPANRTLESVVAGAVARGYLIVAAVGNDGPAAPPLYPAAWPGVVGVTAVDARHRVLAEAERGPQVKLAAPGADMAAARTPRGYALVRGTSFAAPIVAGLLAQALHAPGPAAAEEALAALERQALHPGGPGPDPAYGYGLVGTELAPSQALALRPQ
jgi:subtilisin family serine protease